MTPGTDQRRVVAYGGERRRKTGAAASRRCIASGRVRPRAELIRFVAGPEGVVVPDLAGHLPGRGLWLSAERDMVETACARKLFAKAARAPLRAPEDLVERVERLLVRRCIDLLGLAKRAGHAVCGFEKVAARIGEGKVGLLVQATDAAEDGRHKLRRMLRARDPKASVVDAFTAQELGAALGRGACVHVGIAPGRLAEQLHEEIKRLAALRGEAAVTDRGRTPGRKALNGHDDEQRK